MLKWIWKKPETTAADRDSERFDVAVRVKSRQLPGYRALTIDVSGSGLQLETDSLLEKGQIFNLELDFDREELPDFSCPAEVMWARGDDTRRHYLAGLAFRPTDNDQKLHLARMGAVLETRSEADIQDLLADANKLDPEREAFFAQKEIDKAEPRKKNSAPVTKRQPDEHPGLLIPLDIRIDSYRWERDQSGGSLVLSYAEGQESHELIFPNCQLCHDYGCGFHQSVVGLYATIHSERLREVKAQRGKGQWKHYRFMSPSRDPVLDIISLACQTRLGLF